MTVNTLTGYWQDKHCPVSDGQKFICAILWISIYLSDPIDTRGCFAKDKMVGVWTWLLDLHLLPLLGMWRFHFFDPCSLWIAVTLCPQVLVVANVNRECSVNHSDCDINLSHSYFVTTCEWLASAVYEIYHSRYKYCHIKFGVILL